LVEHAYHATFFAYDWLHDAMSQEDRTAFVNYWKSIDQYAPILGCEAGNCVWSNEQHSRGYGRKILAGLACNADGIDDAWCQSSYSRYYATIRNGTNGMVTRETQRGGTDGSFIQGLGYGESYDAHHLAIVEMGWRTANAITKSDHYQPLEAGYWIGLARYMTYMTRPWAAASPSDPDGYHWRHLKDVYANNSTPFEGQEDVVWWSLLRRELAGVDDDAASLAAWTLAHRTHEPDDPRFWVHSRFLGAKNAELGPVAINLPLRKAFQPGQWQWRTGWSSRNDALVNVFGYEFTGFRSAVGSFSMDYLGPAIIVPGTGGHDFDDAWHGFANSLFSTENRSTIEASSAETEDFGAHRTNNCCTPDFIQNSGGDWLDRTEKFIGGDANSDYGYLWLDLTRSRNGTVAVDPPAIGSSAKVSSVIRSFAVFPPANPGVDSLRVVVADRMTTTDTKYEKRFTLYYSGTPSIDGVASAGPVRNGSTIGKTTYSGATRVTALSGEPTASGKTWVTPLAPASFKIVLVNFRRFGAVWEVEDPYGLMTPVSSHLPENTPYVGGYRTETIPTSQELSDRFVTAIEVTPAASAISATESITGTSFEGGRIGDRIAVFATSDGLTSGNFPIPSAGVYRILIAGLAPGAARTISGGANITSIADVATGVPSPITATAQGTLYLTVIVGASGLSAANLITIT
jgi:hypothetical protein